MAKNRRNYSLDQVEPLLLELLDIKKLVPFQHAEWRLQSETGLKGDSPVKWLDKASADSDKFVQIQIENGAVALMARIDKRTVTWTEHLSVRFPDVYDGGVEDELFWPPQTGRPENGFYFMSTESLHDLVANIRAINKARMEQYQARRAADAAEFGTKHGDAAEYIRALLKAAAVNSSVIEPRVHDKHTSLTILLLDSDIDNLAKFAKTMGVELPVSAP